MKLLFFQKVIKGPKNSITIWRKKLTEKSKEKLKLFFDEKKVDEKVGEKIKLFVH